MKGLAAVAQRKMGKGQIVVLGTMPQPKDLQLLLAAIGQTAGIHRTAEATESLIVVPREGDSGRGMVVVEVENRAGGLVTRGPVVDLLTGREHEGGIDVPPYGVMVLKELDG